MNRMAINVDIDANSGFCAGVIKAIGRAEEFLDREMDGEGRRLYSLGAIVHNESELRRLEGKGLVTIDNEDLDESVGACGETLLIRAHGEPPQTYTKARALGFNVIDCTCPVVLKLQKEIRDTYDRLQSSPRKGQIVIFGKKGHAEVLGLVGQVGGDAVVVENMQSLLNAVEDGSINLRQPVEVFSQTTKSPGEYASICSRLEEMMARENEIPMVQFKGRQMLVVHNTICSQVASRHRKLSKFAAEHDVIVFVAGKASSNGKVLCDLCKSVNIRTYHISSTDELKKEWFRDDGSVGVCGGTSTPKWLLEDVAQTIRQFN